MTPSPGTPAPSLPNVTLHVAAPPRDHAARAAARRTCRRTPHAVRRTPIDFPPMPRVLVVTYQWLPMFNVGVKHVANLCRYLPAAGWDPHILTKDWSLGAAPEDAFWGMSEQ